MNRYLRAWPDVVQVYETISDFARDIYFARLEVLIPELHS